MIASPKTSGAFSTIALAGLTVGVLDIASALIIWASRGTGPVRGLQGISSGILGQESFQGGIATAALGLVIHFFIAFVVVTIFFLASGKLPFLTQHVIIAGLLYGVGVYLFMYWIVLPHVFPKFRHSLSNDTLAVLIHICLIGLPAALVVRAKSKGGL